MQRSSQGHQTCERGYLDKKNKGAMPPPGGWEVPQLIECSETYQSEVVMLVRRAKVPPICLPPPRSKFSGSASAPPHICAKIEYSWKFCVPTHNIVSYMNIMISYLMVPSCFGTILSSPKQCFQVRTMT